MFAVNKNPTPSELGKFGWAMLVGFGAIGLLLWIAHWRTTEDATLGGWAGSGAQVAAVILWAAGVLLAVLCRFAPGPARMVYVLWMKVTSAIGSVMATILLTAMFVLLLPVFSLLVRIGDPLRKKLTPSGTYWEDYKPHEATLERMRRPF